MFMTNVFAGASLQNLDPELERDPPAKPTPVTFPDARTFSHRAWTNPLPPPKLQPLFARILKPTDLSNTHVDALNIQASHGCPPEDLLPTAPDGTSYLPQLSPLTPDQAINATSYAEAAQVDSQSARKRKEFDERVTELRLDHDTAYRVITRTTKPGIKPPRLGYMRKFWEGLESVAQYWDTELDQYYEGPPPKPDIDGEKDAKRQRLGPTPNGPSILTLQTASRNDSNAQDQSQPPASEGQPMVTDEQATPPTSDTADAMPNGRGDEATRAARSTSATPEPRLCLRYKGRRTASGRDMPDQFRVDTVKAFVEGVVWPFQATVAPPRLMPMVQINKLNLPVRQTAAVYRLPKERQKMRQGWLKGPILAIQVRPETDFDAAILSEQQSETKCRLDAMRELGGLLQLAQERQRQGKTEVRPGEGKWWTCKPRWGGGPGGEVEKTEGNGDVKDVLETAEEMVGAAAVAREKSSRRPRRKTPTMLWKELKPGSKLWDPKMEYEAVGKEPRSDYDEVFLVSSLNHHISILKLTVHSAYVEYVRSETLPSPLPVDENWCKPRLQRTQWYDLLNVEQRVQAFRALWGVMAYLTRDIPTSSEASPGATDETGMQNADL